MVSLCFACSKSSDLNSGSIVSVLVDRTNMMALKPDSTTLIKLSGVDISLWDGARVELTLISDKDVNNVYVTKIPTENSWYGNSTMREAQVQKFKNEIGVSIGKLYHDSITELNHSIIWKTIINKLNQISKGKYQKKVCLVYSDLLENGILNFYDLDTRCKIFKHPEFIKNEFLKMAPLNDYSGIDVHLLFAPSSYDENNLYMAIVGIYKEILESHHATVFIESNIVTP